MWGSRRLLPLGLLSGLLVCVVLAASGCSRSIEAMDMAANERPSMESVQNEDPSDSKIVQAGQEPEAVTRWVCVYDPTFNRDWHDDVLCSKGNKHKRPYFRPKDRFVTEDEIMRAAEKYENKLNAGRR